MFAKVKELSIIMPDRARALATSVCPVRLPCLSVALSQFQVFCLSRLCCIFCFRWLIQQLVLNFVQSLKFNYNIRSTRGEEAEGEAEAETEAAADTEDEDDDASLSVLEKVLPLWLITLFGPVQ